MKKIKFILPIVVICGCFLAYAYSNNKNSVNVKNTKISQNNPIKSSKSNPIKIVNSDADFSYTYNNLDEMIKASDVIIQGLVVNVSYFDKGMETYTKSQVKVTKSYNKSINVGDILTFVEIGGITTEENSINELKKQIPKKFNNSNDKTKIKRMICNVDTMNVNQAVMLFGQHNTLVSGGYMPLCSFQGKFIINSDGIIERPENKDIEAVNLKFSQQDMDEKLKLFNK